MHPEVAKRLDKPIHGVAEGADFGPAHNGEDYVTLTFRVPKNTPAIAGIWELTPRGAGSFNWAKAKGEAE